MDIKFWLIGEILAAKTQCSLFGLYHHFSIHRRSEDGIQTHGTIHDYCPSCDASEDQPSIFISICILTHIITILNQLISLRFTYCNIWPSVRVYTCTSCSNNQTSQFTKYLITHSKLFLLKAMYWVHISPVKWQVLSTSTLKGVRLSGLLMSMTHRSLVKALATFSF